MIKTNEYINFLLRTGLTQQQFLLLFLIYKEEQENINKYKERFPNKDTTMIGREATMELLDEGWLKLSKKETLIVTDKFTKYFINSGREYLLNELLREYPAFIDKNGVNIPLVTVEKHTYALKYNRRINNSLSVHKEILKDLKYGVNAGLIRFGIAKFIDSEMWVHLRKLRLQNPEEDPIDINTDMFDEDF